MRAQSIIYSPEREESGVSKLTVRLCMAGIYHFIDIGRLNFTKGIFLCAIIV